MIVLDASVLVEVLLQTEVGAPLGERLLGSGTSLLAPHLVDVEVAQVLWRLIAQGDVDAARAGQALADLADFPLDRCPHELLLPRAWELRANLTIYDGVYVSLAELLEAPLYTRDRRIRRAPGHTARVEVF